MLKSCDLVCPAGPALRRIGRIGEVRADDKRPPDSASSEVRGSALQEMVNASLTEAAAACRPVAGGPAPNRPCIWRARRICLTDRKSDVLDKRVVVLEDLGGRRIFKTQN